MQPVVLWQVVAEQWAQQQQQQLPDLPPFKLGFHSIPSLPQLHLHVISQVNATNAWLRTG